MREEIDAHETRKPGKSPALDTLAHSGDNPTISTRPSQAPFFRRIGGPGGSPTEEGRIVACGRSDWGREKIVSLPNEGARDLQLTARNLVGHGEDVFFSRKTGILPGAVSNFHSAKEVDLSSSVQVDKDPCFANGLSGAHTKAGAEVVGKVSDEVSKIPDKENHEVVDLVKEMGQAPASMLRNLGCGGGKGTLTIGCLTDRVKDLHAVELFQNLFSMRGDEPLTISDFNELLHTLGRHREFESALSLFSELPLYSLSPSCWSFSIMVQCLCKKNEPDKAKDVLNDMMQNGFSPTTVLFTMLTHCFCKKGRLQSAYELFEMMGRIGRHPTIETYNCLINGLCYVGRIEDAFQLLRQIKHSSIKPDIYTFTTVIDGFCKVGRTDEAVELLNDALESGIKPNVVTFNSLINGFCREGRPLEGVGLLKDMKGGGCQPDQISYGTLLQGLLKCGEASAAFKIYQEMMEIGLKVEERVLNTLLRGICRKSMIIPELSKEAEVLLDTIANMGYGLSPYTYCLVIQAFANGGHTSKALAHLNEMERTGYSPRTMTYNMVIRVLCGEGRIDDALLVLILVIKENRTPSVFSCNRLLNEFNQRERFLDACSVYAAALKQGVHLCQEPRKQSKEQK